MAFGLKITLTIDGGPTRTLEFGPIALVGSGRAADLRIPDSAVAPLHLRLSRDRDAIVAMALAPGVVLDGDELIVEHRYDVTGRNLVIGPVHVVPTPSTAGGDVSPQRTDSLARELVRELMEIDATAARVGSPELIVEAGPATGRRLVLHPRVGHVIVGRGEAATWVLPDPDLSRSHAAIQHGDDGVHVCDLGSKNGTSLNGRPVGTIAPGELVTDGAIIALGETRIRYIDPVSAHLASFEAQLAAASPGPASARTRVAASRRSPAGRGGATGDPTPLTPGTRVAITLAALIALVALGLLVALFASAPSA